MECSPTSIIIIHSKPVGTGVPCQEQDCKQLCKMIVYSFALVLANAFESQTERSEERLPKAARDLIKARNAAIEQLLGSQIDLCDLVVAVAKRGKFSAFEA